MFVGCYRTVWWSFCNRKCCWCIASLEQGHMFYWPKGLQWTEILWLWCCDAVAILLFNIWQVAQWPRERGLKRKEEGKGCHFLISKGVRDKLPERERERENYSHCYVLCSNIYIFTNFRAVPICPYICIFCVDSIKEMSKCSSLWFCVLFWVIFLCMVWQMFYAVKVKVRWFKAVEMCLLSGFFFFTIWLR